LDKINVHIIYNLQIFNGHRALCLWFMKHYQTKENWKNNAMSVYKSPFLIYGNGFSPKKKILLCIYCSKMKKTTHFSNEILSKNFKYPNIFRFNLCLSISYTIKKIHPRIPFTTLVLKYIQKNFKLCNMYYFVTNILHTFKFSLFVELLK